MKPNSPKFVVPMRAKGHPSYQTGAPIVCMESDSAWTTLHRKHIHAVRFVHKVGVKDRCNSTYHHTSPRNSIVSTAYAATVLSRRTEGWRKQQWRLANATGDEPFWPRARSSVRPALFSRRLFAGEGRTRLAGPFRSKDGRRREPALYASVPEDARRRVGAHLIGTSIIAWPGLQTSVTRLVPVAVQWIQPCSVFL
jgi:hypothetical protein